jgi:hypothetical protein
VSHNAEKNKLKEPDKQPLLFKYDENEDKPFA